LKKKLLSIQTKIRTHYHFLSPCVFSFKPTLKKKYWSYRTIALTGLLILDWQEQWVEQNKVIAVCCLGDLIVEGDIVNRTLEGGPLLFVGGNLRVDNLVKAGAPVVVLGDVEANGLVIGEYNDGTMRIGGDLTAKAYLLLDHDGFVRGNTYAPMYSDEENEWREVLSDSVFPSEDEDYPEVDLIYAAQKAGMKIFV
jgi:hypothetical protein